MTTKFPDLKPGQVFAFAGDRISTDPQIRHIRYLKIEGGVVELGGRYYPFCKDSLFVNDEVEIFPSPLTTYS